MIANKEEIMILFLSRGYLSVKNIHGKSTDVVSDNLMLHFVRLSYRNEKMKKKEKEKIEKIEFCLLHVIQKCVYRKNTSGFF